MKHVLIEVFLACTVMLGQAVSLETSWATPAEDDANAWLVYQDSILRFKYPREWLVRSTDFSEINQKRWHVTPPAEKPHSLQPFAIKKEIRIIQYAGGYEKRTLDKVVSGLKTRLDPYKMIVGPTKVALLGGECRKYVLEGYVPLCGHLKYHSDKSRPEPPCVRARVDAVCFSKKKRYFEMDFNLSQYYMEGKSDDKMKSNGKIFDAVLKSLEFK